MGVDRRKIAVVLRRTLASVCCRAKVLRIRLPRISYGGWMVWRPEDDQQLRELLAAGMHGGSIGVRLKRSSSAVYRRALRLGLKPAGRHIVPAFWNEERVEQARVWWLQNKSASWIAEQLLLGVTKNSVISKMHRLGYRRSTPPNRTAAARKAAKIMRAKRPPTNYRLTAGMRSLRRPSAPAASLAPVMAVDIARVSHQELQAHHCRWPVGDTASAVLRHQPAFCGARRTYGPYCAAHAMRAYHYLPVAAVDRYFGFAQEGNEESARLTRPGANTTQQKEVNRDA